MTFSHLASGLVALMVSILVGIETSLGDAMAVTGMSMRLEAVAWAIIIILCLAVVVRLMGGWIRTVLVMFLLLIAVHAGVTHGLGSWS